MNRLTVFDADFYRMERHRRDRGAAEGAAANMSAELAAQQDSFEQRVQGLPKFARNSISVCRSRRGDEEGSCKVLEIRSFRIQLLRTMRVKRLLNTRGGGAAGARRRQRCVVDDVFRWALWFAAQDGESQGSQRQREEDQK